MYGSGAGADFIPFDGSTPCVDSASSASPSCGWALDGARARVADSQGYCCACDGSGDGSSAVDTRGELACTTTASQSSHCLRDDPLFMFVVAGCVCLLGVAGGREEMAV